MNKGQIRLWWRIGRVSCCSFLLLLLSFTPTQAAPTRFTSPNYAVESVIFGGTGVLRSSEASIPPIITKGPTVSNIQTNAATFTWTTDKPSNSVVFIGTSSGTYPIQTGQLADMTITDHTVTVSNLTRGTAYYYKVRSTDVAGNEVESGESSFSTDPGDITPPKITSGPSIGNTSATSFIVTWETDEIASSVVEYGITGVDENSAGKPDELTLFHQVEIRGLSSNQTYLLRIKSKDASGNLYTGVTQQITTPSSPSITGVKISDITLDSALVQWQTTTESDSHISYGTASSVYTQNAQDDSFVQNHLMRLSGLTSGTVYYLRLAGQDQSGNQLSSDEYAFKTVILPTIGEVTVSKLGSDSATLNWNSSSDIDEILRYTVTDSTFDTGLIGKKYSAANEALVSNHTMTLSDLDSSTTYQVTVLGKDVFGNQAIAKVVSFTTAADHDPPQIQNVQTDTSVDLGSKQTVQVLVSFGLSELGKSIIEYGSGANGPYDHSVTTDTDFSVSKFLVIPQLHPGESYHFHIVATDRTGNKATSADYLVLAPSQPVSLLDLIFGQIQQNFGWLETLHR